MKTTRDTLYTLLHWDREHGVAERLAAQLLSLEGFLLVDPIHPGGGPDGRKDIICQKSDVKYVCGVYFPTGAKSFSKIKEKFVHDYSGVAGNNAQGFVFVTNQKLTSKQREALVATTNSTSLTEVFHLDRIAQILNSPQSYGIRLEFLEIGMSNEEQLAFFAYHSMALAAFAKTQKEISDKFDALVTDLAQYEGMDFSPLEKIREFRNILNELTEHDGYSSTFAFGGNIGGLRVPLAELVEFKRLLDTITGWSGSATLLGTVRGLQVPLKELKEFSELLSTIVGEVGGFSTMALAIPGHLSNSGRIASLRVPVNDLKEYEAVLDRVLDKLRQKSALEK